MFPGTKVIKGTALEKRLNKGVWCLPAPAPALAWEQDGQVMIMPLFFYKDTGCPGAIQVWGQAVSMAFEAFHASGPEGGVKPSFLVMHITVPEDEPVEHHEFDIFFAMPLCQEALFQAGASGSLALTPTKQIDEVFSIALDTDTVTLDIDRHGLLDILASWATYS